MKNVFCIFSFILILSIVNSKFLRFLQTNGNGNTPNGSGNLPNRSGTPPNGSGNLPNGSGTPPNGSGNQPNGSFTPPNGSGTPPNGSFSSDKGSQNGNPLNGAAGNNTQNTANEDEEFIARYFSNAKILNISFLLFLLILL